jgi:hypothetical protein
MERGRPARNASRRLAVRRIFHAGPETFNLLNLKTKTIRFATPVPAGSACPPMGPRAGF